MHGLLTAGAHAAAQTYDGVTSLQLAVWHQQGKTAAALREATAEGGAVEEQDLAMKAEGESAGELLDRSSACGRVAEQRGLVGSGGVGATFTATEAAFGGEVSVLSRDPWLLTIDQFLSANEVARLLATCNGRWSRSTDGDQNSQSKLDGAYNPCGTSSHCWYIPRPGCPEPHCAEDVTLRGVRDRIARATGAPLANVGSAQLLKYAEGGFYDIHHDQTQYIDPPLPEVRRR